MFVQLTVRLKGLKVLVADDFHVHMLSTLSLCNLSCWRFLIMFKRRKWGIIVLNTSCVHKEDIINHNKAENAHPTITPQSLKEITNHKKFRSNPEKDSLTKRTLVPIERTIKFIPTIYSLPNLTQRKEWRS